MDILETEIYNNILKKLQEKGVKRKKFVIEDKQKFMYVDVNDIEVDVIDDIDDRGKTI